MASACQIYLHLRRILPFFVRDIGDNRGTGLRDTTMDPNIVVLAAGVSSRMKNSARDAGSVDPLLLREAASKAKSMLGVGRGGRPFMDYVLRSISRAGYRDVVLVVGEHDNSIRGYYEEQGGIDRFPDLRLTFVVQPKPPGRTKPLGTADALYCSLVAVPRWRGYKFTVCNSDNLYAGTALRLLLEDTHPNAMIDYDRSALRFPPERIEHFSVIKKDQAGFLIDITEKPTPDDIAAARDAGGRIGVSMNLFRFSYDVILPCLEKEPLHPVRLEKELPGAVRRMVRANPRTMFTIPLSEHVIDLTSASDIPAVQAYLDGEFPDF